MVWPSVTITQLNTFGGVTKSIERALLFVGAAAANQGTVVPVIASSDLDALFGNADCALKNEIAAFFKNAGQGAFCYAAVMTAGESSPPEDGEFPMQGALLFDWRPAIRRAQAQVSVEGVIITAPVSTQEEIQAAQELRTEINNALGRWLWFALPVAGIDDETETWAEYTEKLTALQQGIAAPQVQLVPTFFGNEIGVLAGRLCNAAVTIADSPARVATGPLQGLKNLDKPIDSAGKPLDLATLQALARMRYSVPMWYADYDGLYWADGATLEVEGGDYGVIENVRVVDKAARRIRIMAIPKVANRILNSTQGSIAAHELLFGKPLREMAKSVQIGGVTFPGEIRPPKDGDVKITWPEASKAAINFIIRPYNCPKEITTGIMLDTGQENNV
ncbi:DUF2586 domain-containing protein [Edwardsiella anguillarum]|uniref:DUF2586 domain-containing protein n=1 Tax=Edwardsiella anguillarum TaxID=1821960 RepID=A0ABY8SA25_9GAMM|nr:DUF2586 domain-containing protein [Edwardsiella anguillarum]WHP82430.1 DUF2586 domain-containing protein [Edwardsiella anguillarum]WHP86229.1 DUF2586 domain-containing protein [Edwardsiella anguillarum]WHP90027.1 DUF2586 domain-containing protein [Edwardsiella anguillarum]WHP93825.1 DUF2586 domain-containing protein [Edwardsiella anguillarum]WHP97685.1 DUF2586 domain-containing protein [Edwardsiella anguillarum]